MENRWALPWGDKARAASLAVGRAKAAARASGLGGKYEDGSDVIKDLTDLPDLSPSGVSYIRASGSGADSMNAAYAAELADIARRYAGAQDGIEAFNAAITVLAGVSSAAGAANPGGAVSRAFGSNYKVGRVGGLSAVVDPSGQVQGWSKVGSPYGRPAAARGRSAPSPEDVGARNQNKGRPPYDEELARQQREFVDIGPSPAARPGEPGYGRRTYVPPDDVLTPPRMEPWGVSRRLSLPSFSMALGRRRKYSLDPLNDPKTKDDYAFLASYQKHLDEIRQASVDAQEADYAAAFGGVEVRDPERQATLEQLAAEGDEAAVAELFSEYGVMTVGGADAPAAELTVGDFVYPTSDNRRETLEQLAAEGDEAAVAELWAVYGVDAEAGEAADVYAPPAGGAAPLKSLADLPALPTDGTSALDPLTAVDDLIDALRWSGPTDTGSGMAVFGPDGANNVYVPKAHPEEALEAARALGVLHGMYGVSDQDPVPMMSTAMAEEYDLGRAEGAAGHEYGVVVPGDRAGVLRRAQMLLKYAKGDDDDYMAEHLSGANARKWETDPGWDLGTTDVPAAAIKDLRMRYSPNNLLGVAMDWFRDSVVKKNHPEANAALYYMNELMMEMAGDTAAVVAEGRPVVGAVVDDDGAAPEIDSTMPLFDEDGVEVQMELPIYEDTLADPAARQPWDYEAAAGAASAPAASVRRADPPAAPRPAKVSVATPESIEAARKWRLETARKLIMGNRDRILAAMRNKDDNAACAFAKNPTSECKCRCGGAFHGIENEAWFHEGENNQFGQWVDLMKAADAEGGDGDKVLEAAGFTPEEIADMRQFAKDWAAPGGMAPVVPLAGGKPPAGNVPVPPGGGGPVPLVPGIKVAKKLTPQQQRALKHWKNEQRKKAALEVLRAKRKARVDSRKVPLDPSRFAKDDNVPAAGGAPAWAQVQNPLKAPPVFQRQLISARPKGFRVPVPSSVMYVGGSRGKYAAKPYVNPVNDPMWRRWL
ncbi:MAG: hypothetical protein WCK89_16310 [bacterium]